MLYMILLVSRTLFWNGLAERRKHEDCFMA